MLSRELLFLLETISIMKRGFYLFILFLGTLFGSGKTTEGQTLKKADLDSLQSIVDNSTNDSIKVSALNKLALHYLFSDTEKALQLIDEGISEAGRVNLLYNMAELLNTKASYFDILSEKDSAIHYFNKSLAISKENKFYKTEVFTLNGLGLYFWKTGKFDEALNYFFKAMEKNEQHFKENIESKANFMSNIGLIYQELKQFNKAISYHLKALEIRKELNLLNGQAISYANLGVCYQNTKSYDSSEVFYKKAIEKADSAGNRWMYYSLHDNLGGIYTLTDKIEAAISAYKTSLERPADLGENPKNDLSVYINLASLYNKLNKPQMALHFADNGFEVLKRHPQLNIFSEGLHFAHAESNYMLGNISEGSKSMLNFRNVLDSIFSENNAAALAEMETKYEAIQKDKSLLEKEKIIQDQELILKNRTIWLIFSIGILLLIAATLFHLYNIKKADAKNMLLELQLTEETERRRIQEERARISRELHDNIGSYLTLINATVEQLPEADSGKIANNMNELQHILSLSMHELRKTVWLLNNQEISIDNLALRLREFFKPLGKNGIKIFVHIEENLEHMLSDIQATHLFRIIQEAVNNAFKYAFCTKIDINLTANSNNTLQFEISDNGNGFEASHTKSGNGLINMQSRIADLKGNIKIESEIGKGTKILGSFSLNQTAK